MNPIVRYKNGNYTVTIDLRTGTKIRENNLDYFHADFPESMDIKITNRCHNGCVMCHEHSTCNGKHGDIMSKSFIDKLHPYTELAVGGGNPLEHPDLEAFLRKLKSLKMIPSMTIRQNDFMDNIDYIRKLVDEKLIYGIGISLVNPDDEFIEAVKQFKNAVIHVINGIVKVCELEHLANNGLKILILGYKEFRKGAEFYADDNNRKKIESLKSDLYGNLSVIVEHNWFDVVSFDNLAIKQLEPQRLMNKSTWNEMYMGDDGIDGEMTSASMFVDMVEGNFAKNSCSAERYPLMDNIEDMFNYLRKKDV